MILPTRSILAWDRKHVNQVNRAVLHAAPLTVAHRLRVSAMEPRSPSRLLFLSLVWPSPVALLTYSSYAAVGAKDRGSLYEIPNSKPRYRPHVPRGQFVFSSPPVPQTITYCHMQLVSHHYIQSSYTGSFGILALLYFVSISYTKSIFPVDPV